MCSISCRSDSAELDGKLPARAEFGCPKECIRQACAPCTIAPRAKLENAIVASRTKFHCRLCGNPCTSIRHTNHTRSWTCPAGRGGHRGCRQRPRKVTGPPGVTVAFFKLRNVWFDGLDVCPSQKLRVWGTGSRQLPQDVKVCETGVVISGIKFVCHKKQLGSLCVMWSLQ